MTCIQCEEFRHPASRLRPQHEVKCHIHRIYVMNLLSNSENISHTFRHTVMIMLAQLQGQGLSGRSKVTCIEFVSDPYHETLL